VDVDAWWDAVVLERADHPVRCDPDVRQPRDSVPAEVAREIRPSRVRVEERAPGLQLANAARGLPGVQLAIAIVDVLAARMVSANAPSGCRRLVTLERLRRCRLGITVCALRADLQTQATRPGRGTSMAAPQAAPPARHQHVVLVRLHWAVKILNREFTPHRASRT